MKIFHAGDLGPEPEEPYDDCAEDHANEGDDLAIMDAIADEVHVHDDLMKSCDDDDDAVNKWLVLCDTDSECESQPLPDESFGKACVRVRAVESQPEFQRLKTLGLAIHPEGCTLGIHPANRVWRSSSASSSHFSRSFDGSAGRNSWQALLRVVEMMLESYLDSNPKSKHVKAQLAQIKKLRSEEPQHKD